MKKRMLSGVKPTGRPHIGNYFGSIKQFVEMQDSGYEVFAFVANLHALISVQDKIAMKEDTIGLVKDYMACGLDPEKITLFLQSDVSAHTELNWIFNCLVTVPYMERAHAYKDALANGKEATVGLFDYPVLMAADILLYSPDLVPVGSDQKQHVEYARDIAGKFNNTFGETFKLPDVFTPASVAIVPGIDGRKMSKSYKNHIPLFGTDEEIKKICMSIVTDSAAPADKKDPDTNNIYNMYKVIANENETAEFRKQFEDGGLGYKEAKEILADKIIEFVTPMRERRNQITDNQVFEVMKAGAKKAQEVANAKMDEVREKTGLIKNH